MTFGVLLMMVFQIGITHSLPLPYTPGRPVFGPEPDRELSYTLPFDPVRTKKIGKMRFSFNVFQVVRSGQKRGVLVNKWNELQNMGQNVCRGNQLNFKVVGLMNKIRDLYGRNIQFATIRLKVEDRTEVTNPKVFISEYININHHSVESKPELDGSHPKLWDTNQPTKSPTKLPTKLPTNSPSNLPTKSPTKSPSILPTKYPTGFPSKSPSKSPTQRPTDRPTVSPSSASPTEFPSHSPTTKPTKSPTKKSSASSKVKPIALKPTVSPITKIMNPSSIPTEAPSKNPTSSVLVDVPSNGLNQNSRSIPWNEAEAESRENEMTSNSNSNPMTVNETINNIIDDAESKNTKQMKDDLSKSMAKKKNMGLYSGHNICIVSVFVFVVAVALMIGIKIKRKRKQNKETSDILARGIELTLEEEEEEESEDKAIDDPMERQERRNSKSKYTQTTSGSAEDFRDYEEWLTDTL